MKKMLTIGGSSPHAVKKALLIMKLTFLFVFAAMLKVSAKVEGQERVSIKLNGVEISKALNAIERHSTYRFLYNSRLEDIRKKVSVDASDLEIREVLNKMFTGTDLAYKILDNNLIVVLSSVLAFQDIKITGHITTATGEALSGVSISVKGSDRGTTTDNYGNFTLTVPEKAILVVSYIGYQSQEVPVNSQAVINVQLAATQTPALDQVVVIGYGTANKRDLTGSIVKIEGKEVADKPNTNPIASLQDKVAGLSIVNNATPGATPDIRIRGTISIGQVHPLYVVDGVLNDDINFLNPNDIESIEVLKDPSSLAIFGVRGAAGAIVITTKRAKAGQAIVNFNSSFGAKQMVDQIQMANGPEFKSILTQEGQNRFFDNGYTTINNFVANDLGKWTGNTDWIKAITRTAHTSSNNISVAAGTDRNRFYMSTGYTTDQGLVMSTNYNRFSISVADEYKVSKFIKVGFSVDGSRENLPIDGSGPLNAAMQVAPIISSGTQRFFAHDPYGGPTDSGFYNLYSSMPTIQNTLANPILQINQAKTMVNIRTRAVASAYIDINFLKNFDFRATAYTDLSSQEHRAYTPLQYQYNPDPFPGAPQVISYGSFLTSVTADNIDVHKYQTDFILNYKKQFGDHSITATGGFTTYYTGDYDLHGQIQQAAGADPIPNDKRFWYITTGFGDPNTARSSTIQDEATTVSGLLRVLYNYQNKYYINGSYRRDYSSQINGNYDKQGQDFWAVGAAWELTRENFMSGQKFFNYLKLKGSTGILGNANTNVNGVFLPYPYYPAISPSSSAVFGSNTVNAYTTAYTANPNLHWETVRSTEVGIEFAALENRLHFEADYYRKLTKDLLVELQFSGTEPQLLNDGVILNKGFEFTGSWNQKIDRDWSFTVGGNLTTYKNNVQSIGNPLLADPQVPSQTLAGHPIGYFVGYKVIGLYQSYADILHSPPSSVNGQPVAPGDLKYADINHDGKIDGKDVTQIGNPTPKFGYGASLNVIWKHLELSTDIGGVYGNQIYREWGTSLQQNSLYNYPKYDVNAWHGAGTSNWIPIVDAQHLNNRAPSSYGIEDGSYVRIRNLQLGYSFPATLLGNSHIKGLRIYVNVQNLKTWKHNLGYSPEYGGSTGQTPLQQAGSSAQYTPSATTFGVDIGDASSALPRIWTGGVNLTF